MQFCRASNLLLSIPDDKRQAAAQSEPNVLNAFEQDEDEDEDEDETMLARRHMELKQYHQAVFVLQDCESPKALFMRIYSQYIVRYISSRSSHIFMLMER